MRKFNVNGICYPQKHYMVDLGKRLEKIKELVDEGSYFTMNRARQYGKTTTLWALRAYLQEKYIVVSVSFQRLSAMDFSSEYSFVSAFSDVFTDALESGEWQALIEEPLAFLRETADGARTNVGLRRLFKVLSKICASAPKPVVLLIDEVDSASNNQVFLDFLAQLRDYYLHRDTVAAFWSVILAGVYDIKNLKRKLRPEEEHKYNSPWNIAADFNIDMSFSAEEIAGMLTEYAREHQMEMDVLQIAQLLYDYTSGYPFLVSRICKIMDEKLSGKWTDEIFREAIRELLKESNTLFDDMVKKLSDVEELRSMLYEMLFEGKSFAYNPDNPVIDIGKVFGFLKDDNGVLAVSNRIFETRLYNLFLSEEMLKDVNYEAALLDKNQFVTDGELNMDLVLRKFVEHFSDIYADSAKAFLEENGRRFFLLYLKPIINGAGNYYIEAQTRSMTRTDIVVDYRGKQYVIEMKIWHGDEYHKRGEQQLAEYLDYYHLKKGYLLSFNFNKNKSVGVKEVLFGDKVIIEAVV